MYTPKIAQITVTGGAGSVTATVIGTVVGVGVKPPSGTAEYDFEILDEDSFGVSGESGLRGTATVRDFFQCHGVMTLAISNATADGTYRVKIWFQNS